MEETDRGKPGFPRAALGFVVLLASCSFDGSAPPNARIRCEASSECPSGLVCRTGFCIDPTTLDLTSADLAEPPMVAPARGRAGAVFNISLVTTRPLIEEPEITLRFEEPVVVRCTPGSDAVHFTCAYTAVGNELGGLGGQVDFDVRLLDTSGNETVRRSVGVLNLDFSPPVLALATVGPAVARFGSTIEVFFNASEPLLGPAVVTASRGLDDGSGGTVSTFSLNPEGATLIYRLTHVVTAQDPAGDVSFSVVMTDVAGNISATLPIGKTRVDGTLPAVLNVAVAPARAKVGTPVVATFEVSKPLAAPPTVTLGGIAMMRDSNVAPPLYRYTHSAAPIDGEGQKSVLVTGNDLAGNVFSDTLGVVTFDFTPPGLAAASALYTPATTNPLTSVTRAKAGTLITIGVIANEPLATATGLGVPPTLTATNGNSTLTFCLVGLTCPNDTRPSSYTETGATFEVLVPQTAVDGSYTPTLTWADLAGNTGTATFSSPQVLVKTSTPVLSVNQAQVSYVRSPWGNASPENLGSFTFPSGPYFALAPADALSNVASLPANTFAIAGGPLQRVRVWTSATSGTLLGTLVPNEDGSWPRLQLANVDVPHVFAGGVDEAGNESATVKITSAEFVATPNPAAAGANPNRLIQSSLVEPTLAQALQAPAGSGAQGADGAAILARATTAWRRATLGDVRPSARDGHAMAYDTARGRVVMFGGFNGTYAQDIWEWDGVQWTEMTPAGVRPSARRWHAMVYDSGRGRVVMFGGSNGTSLQDIWEWDGVNWTDRTPTGTKPSPRDAHAMAYDSARGRVVMFGGIQGFGPTLQDVWEWDGANWVDRTPAGTKPTARRWHSMAYDSARNRTVMFGGYNLSELQDTWEWDGVNWVDKTPAGTKPSARYRHAMAYDSAHGRVVMFGAGAADVWEWDGTNWASRTPLGSTPNLGPGSAMVYDTARARMVLFGGFELAIAKYWRDVWEWDGVGWANKTPSGIFPSPRTGDALAYDSARGRVVMFGGYDAATLQYRQDVWEWDGANWVDVTPAGTKPSARSGHAMVYDSGRARVVMFGGYFGGTDYQDIWEWDGTNWTNRTPAGTKPIGRDGHKMAYDSVRARVVMFGGSTSSSGYQQDVWEWDGTSWTNRTPAGTKPSARYGHAMAYDAARSRVVLFGGYDGATSQNLQDVWEWDGTNWVNRTPTGTKPSPRSGHALVYDGARGHTVMLGGNSVAQDVWEWDGVNWSDKTPIGTRPTVAYWNGAVYDGFRGRVVMVGGPSGASRQEVWEWNGSPTRQPAVAFSVNGAGYVDSSTVTGARVRAHCGAIFHPYGAANGGATLYGWATSGTGAPLGGWRALATNSTGINLMQPWLPVPNAARIEWSSASAVQARQFILERETQLVFQCRPSGTSGAVAAEAQVALDYIEVRVRYAAP